MTTTIVSPLRAARLLVGLRVIRLMNQISSAWARRGRSAKANTRAVRQGTAGKSRGWMLGAFVALTMLITYSNLSRQVLKNVKQTLGVAQDASRPFAPPHSEERADVVQEEHSDRTHNLPAFAGHKHPFDVLRAAAMQVCLGLLTAFLIALGSKELAQSEWDMQWLSTLPINLHTLLGIKMLERTLVNPIGFVSLAPFLFFVARDCGYGAWSAAVALALTLPLLFLAAVTQTVVETLLRLTQHQSRLRDIQAVLSIVGVIAVIGAVSTANPAGAFLIEWSKAWPPLVMWTPPGLAIGALSATSMGVTASRFAILLLQVGVVGAAGLVVLSLRLRFGLVAAGARETGGKSYAAGPIVEGQVVRRRWLSAVQRRELRLLARDRNFAVQTLVLPIIIVASQLWIGGRGSSFIQSPSALAAVAFGVAAFALQFSALQTLNAEGNALWILYSLPKPLERVLRDKAVLWICISLIYPVAILLGGALWFHMPLAKLARVGFVALLGVPVYALIATALGVFACDPLAEDVRRRVRVSYVYLYMSLASVYIYAIYQDALWPRLVLFVLTALLAFALWQKAKDQLPFLLDPTSSPAPRVSLADGVIAAILFLVLQIIVVAIARDGSTITGTHIFFAFSLAGACTFLIMRLFYWRARTLDVPRFFVGFSASSCLWALGAAAVACASGLAYVRLIERWQWLREALLPTVVPTQDLDVWLVLVAVVAAPVFEEFIFRGLVFGGFRRTLGRWPAIFASAVIFAVVHPAVSFPPVFVLGVCAAFVYERQRVLLAPMIVHAVYNAAVIFIR